MRLLSSSGLGLTASYWTSGVNEQGIYMHVGLNAVMQDACFQDIYVHISGSW